VDIDACANLEVVDKFCYLGDMLSVDGDADAAVEARIRIGLALVFLCFFCTVVHFLIGECVLLLC